MSHSVLHKSPVLRRKNGDWKISREPHKQNRRKEVLFPKFLLWVKERPKGETSAPSVGWGGQVSSRQTENAGHMRVQWIKSTAQQGSPMHQKNQTKELIACLLLKSVGMKSGDQSEESGVKESILAFGSHFYLR